MDIKELKLNHIVQIRKENECPRTCLITNIGDNYVDVEVVNNNTVESMPHVDIETIFPIDLLETHVLALGFIKTEQTLYPELYDYSVYLYNKNGKTVYVVKNNRFHLLINNKRTGQYEVEKKLLTLHSLQNEIATTNNMVDAVNKKTFLKLSERYQITIKKPTISK